MDTDIYTIIPPKKSGSPVFCFCDHATHAMPQKYNNLGLSIDDLRRHIGWDIGAAHLTRQFCKTFGASGLLAGFSRLLIDPNRGLDDGGLIPEISDGTLITGNQNLNATERNFRINTYYEPYHQILDQQIAAAMTRFHDPLIISIHSFTPKPTHGTLRDVDIGLLWKVDEDKAQSVKAEVERVHPYNVALNQPYSALTLNHTMDRHVVPRGLRHITLEIRQDLIDTDVKAKKLASHLSAALTHFMHA